MKLKISRFALNMPRWRVTLGQALMIAFVTVSMVGCGGGGGGATPAPTSTNSSGTSSGEVQPTIAKLSLYAGDAVVSTPAGGGVNARFLQPQVMAIDAQGTLYIRDFWTIRKIPSDKVVSDIQTVWDASGLVQDIFISKSGEFYFSTIQNVIGKLGAGVLAGLVLPNAAVPPVGSSDGQGPEARFNEPRGLVVDSLGNILVADRLNHTIRKISPGGLVTTLAGLAGVSGTVDGRGALARFNNPMSLAIDAANTLYVAGGDCTIRKIAQDGTVTTIAGKAGISGAVDGPGSAALFSTLVEGIAVSDSGNIYVADWNNHLIRKIANDGTVSTIAGSAGTAGYEMGNLPGRISWPSGLVMRGSTLYFGTRDAVVQITDVP